MSTARRTTTRFYFFLNPYADMAFTRCPKCEAKTKQRKLPLAVRNEYPLLTRDIEKTPIGRSHLHR